jgi:AcrR family transcriptional regulator
MTEKLSLDLAALLKEQELYDNPLTDKQRDILRAAEKLFSEQGYAETPTASIAKAANVTEKTLFKHFPTKADLLRRVLFPLLVRTIVPVQMRKVRALLAAPYATYRELFTQFAQDRWDLLRDLGPRMKLVIAELLGNDKLRADFGKLWADNLWGDIVRTIEQFQKKGDLRDDVSAAQIARLQIVVIAGHAVFHGIWAREVPFDPKAQAEILAKLLYEGIGKKT